MTGLGYHRLPWIAKPVLHTPSNVVVTGRAYHRLQDLKVGNHSLRWFLYDEAGRQAESRRLGVPLPLVQAWRTFLREVNPFVLSVQAAHDQANGGNFETTIAEHVAGREMAAVWNVVNMQTFEPRKIVIKAYGSEEPQYISIFSRNYEPLQYPILFPYGEPGWHRNNQYGYTQIVWYRIRLLNEYRFQQFSRCGQEWMVDNYSRVEEERIDYQRRGKLRQLEGRNSRAEGSLDTSRQDDQWQTQLSSSFMGSKAWATEHIADALTLCRTYGKPTLYLTMTTNPNWKEIKDRLGPGQEAADIPHIVVRVFHKKMRRMIKLLKKAAGGFVYMIWVVEFQKRGLPHCHMLIRLKGEMSVSDVDSLVSAELPTEAEDPQLRALILKHMMHPKDHLLREYSRCHTKAGTCQYEFPLPLEENTRFDEAGKIYYRRRKEEDRWVVSHIPGLIRALQTHIHTEVCSNVGIVMYLYKYLFKGPDKARVAVVQTDADGNSNEDQVFNELDNFAQSRYLSSSEACWRIFSLQVTSKDPAVETYRIHLPGRQLGSIAQSGPKWSTASDLLYYFARPDDAVFDNILYTDYYCIYARKLVLSQNEQLRQHWLEKQVPGNPKAPQYVIKKRGKVSLGRISLIPVKHGEPFYLRLLLREFPARSFKDLRTVRGVEYRTFQEAAQEHGLFRDADEANHTLQEGVDLNYSPQLLRFMFAQLLIDIPTPAVELWERFKEHMVLDFIGVGSTRRKEKMALLDLQRMLRENGTSLNHFGLPEPTENPGILDQELDVLEDEAENYREEFLHMSSMLNEEQKELFSTLKHHVEAGEPMCIFVDGRAGRGKSFVLQCFVAWCRSQQWIVLIVGSTALSVQSYKRGRTAHSMFGVPVSMSGIELQSMVTPSSGQFKLIKAAKVIIWEELPMINKSVLECVEALLRPLRKADVDVGFGNTLFIGTGDFRQVAPVVVGGHKAEVVDASVKSSDLWEWFTTYSLQQPVRFRDDDGFSSWLDAVGDDRIPYEDVATRSISLQQFRVLKSAEDAIDVMFPPEVLHSPKRCLKMAILSPINEIVDKYNHAILERLEGSTTSLFSYTEIKEDRGYFNSMTEELVKEYLPAIQESGVPPHHLKIKLGCVCTLMRNISPRQGLVKNLRVVVESIGKHSVLVRKIDSSPPDRQLYALTRIFFEFIPRRANYTVVRRQFPLRLAYATTFNSCQGLTLDKVALDTRKQPFSHGQLYTALSRVRKAEDLFIIASPDFKENDKITLSNVMYSELL